MGAVGAAGVTFWADTRAAVLKAANRSKNFGYTLLMFNELGNVVLLAVHHFHLRVHRRARARFNYIGRNSAALNTKLV